MKAQVINDYGDVSVFGVQDMPVPEPGEGQVRVRVQAVGLNPLEIKIRAGLLKDQMPVSFPLILGYEMAGVVDAVGEGVQGHAVGSRVVGLTETGAYAEYALARGDNVAAIPEGLDVEQAATIPTAAETAQRGLSQITPKHGETVVVNGAAGSVGSAVVQLLVRYGANVIGTASEDNHDYVRRLGATPTTYGQGVVGRIRDLATDGVDAVFDVTNHGFIDAAIELRGGPDRIVTISDGAAASRGVAVTFGDASKITSASYAPILKLAAVGDFAAEIARTFDFEDVPAAHEFSENGHLRGKIIVTGPIEG